MTFLALTQAAQALLDSIETDEGGQVGKTGNGGLLSRKTLILVGQLRAELLRTKTASMPEQTAWAFPSLETGLFPVTDLFASEEDARDFDRVCGEEYGETHGIDPVEVIVTIRRKAPLS